MSLDVDSASVATPEVPEGRVIDPHLLRDIKRYGDLDVSACYNCGTCTAVCPLADHDGSFPRRMIRYGQVGLAEDLLSSKELWTCYHCGVCTDNCPQRADPGEYMAAARRYAIARYDKTGLARAMYTRPALSTALSVALALAFATLLYAFHGARDTASLRLFSFVPENVVHWSGVGVFVFLALMLVIGVGSMVRGLAAHEGVRWRMLVGEGRRRAWHATWDTLAVESMGLRRYREDCYEAQADQEPLYRRRWLVHGLTMWGFFGLLAATILDYGLALGDVRRTGAVVPVWYPVRLLGTLAGLAFLYGVSVLLLNRLRRANRAVQHSYQSDWMLLVMLWLIGFSGLVTELALYLPGDPQWGYWVALAHISLALELLFLLPFTKFAHVIYRPVALFFHSLAATHAGTGDAL